jgi:hypothetical protein
VHEKSSNQHFIEGAQNMYKILITLDNGDKHTKSFNFQGEPLTKESNANFELDRICHRDINEDTWMLVDDEVRIIIDHIASLKIIVE